MWFHDLSAARKSDEGRPQPFNHGDIRAYSELMNEPVDPWEVGTLRAMDDAYVAATLKCMAIRQKRD